jgi:endoglucanase
LRTSGRWILDANGQRFKLASVSWYGFDSPDFVAAGLDHVALPTLAERIRQLGFNAVRLPFSNELVETNPTVQSARLSANPGLQGLQAMQVLDRVIDALAAQGLVVLLDNHISKADWCCSDSDGNGLWYTAAYPESAWLADWRVLATRYLTRPAVVGVELRNELRPANGVAPTWGGADPLRDWRGAAQKAGNAILQVNPNLLIAVDGLNYSADLTGPYTAPLTFSVANRLVYAPHDYEWFHADKAYAAVKTQTGNQWGYLLTQGQAYTAPVWVSEFGTCNTSDTCVSDSSGGGLWFQSFLRVLDDADVDWGYWPLNGTEASGTGRTLGAADSYGVLDAQWAGASRAALIQALRSRQPITQRP